MASASAARAEVVRPAVRPRPRRRSRTRARARVGVFWIVISGILLAGVVFVSVAVLRLNMALDQANTQRTNLQAQIASLQGEVATQAASWRIQSEAEQKLGVVPVDPSQIGYVDLSKK